MIINLENSRIDNLSPGEFAIPSLDYKDDLPSLKRERYTTRALITNLLNNNYSDILESVLPIDYNDFKDDQLLKHLEFTIIKKINEYNENGQEDILIEIFHSIQIWGGNTARRFYLNNGVEQNFKIKSYKDGIVYLKNGQLDKAICSFREIKQMNIAFASKHFSFWTRSLQGVENKKSRQLPILDRLINNVCFGRNSQPDYRHYSNYVENIYFVIN